jgi:hypothetical protein
MKIVVYVTVSDRSRECKLKFGWWLNVDKKELQNCRENVQTNFLPETLKHLVNLTWYVWFQKNIDKLREQWIKQLFP